MMLHWATIHINEQANKFHCYVLSLLFVVQSIYALAHSQVNILNVVVGFSEIR